MTAPPTLLDVATRAGVSTATVSRCLNFPDRVSAKAKAKVNAAVDALGYAPNFGARAMAARRTNTIGAVIPTMENAVFARGLQAFQEELRDHGFTMLVASTSYSAQVEEEQIRALVARGADALLLIGHDRAPEIYAFLDAQGVPYLVTWAFDLTEDRPSVGFDNRAAMRELAAAAIAMGHQRIGFLSAQMAENDRARARYHGVRDAMGQGGLTPDDLCVFETTYGVETGAAGFEALMRMEPRPTVVICGSDVLAVGALRGAKQMGIAVPETVSITGFDDMELAQIVDPMLTTVHVPHRDMGRRAALALVGAVVDGLPLEVVQLPANVVRRGSLAAP